MLQLDLSQIIGVSRTRSETMSSDGPEYDDPRCPGCGRLTACTCPTLAAEYIPVYEALKAAQVWGTDRAEQ